MRIRTLVLTLLALSACHSETDLTGPIGPGGDEARLRVTAFVVGTPVATLVLDVSATDIPQPLLFNLTASNGTASGTLRLPPGEARTIAVRAFDAAGEVTHEGTLVVDIKPGPNPPVTITLRPRAGQLPITVTFGELSVLVAPATLSIPAGRTAPLTATVIDVDGNALPAAVDWATSNPAFASVNASGTVTGILPGAVTIAATYEGVVGYAQVTIMEGPVGALTGTVSSDVLGPLEGVTVSNGIQSAVTDANGVYLIEDLPTGSHDFTVSSLPVTCAAAPGFDVVISEGATATRNVAVTCTPNLAGSYTGTGGSDINASVSGFPVGVSSESFLGCTEPCAASASVAHVDATSLTATVTVGSASLTGAFTAATNAGATTITMAPAIQVFNVVFNGTTVPLTCTFSTPVPIPVANPTGTAAIVGAMQVSCTGNASGLNVTATGTIDVNLTRSAE